jgi:hypothetical protein
MVSMSANAPSISSSGTSTGGGRSSSGYCPVRLGTRISRPAHGVQHENVTAHPQQAEAFAPAPGVLGDGRLAGAAERLDEEFVGLGRDLEGWRW